MRIRTAVVITTAMSVLATTGVGVAGAAPPADHPPHPIGSCPAGFDFAFATDQLPPTSGVQSVDINGDGVTCVNLIAFSNPHGIRFAAVDNVVPPRL
jgi:hypothetical protein